jgi:hypothetical protein
VDLVTAVVADEQPLVVVEPSERALDDPAGATEAGAVLGMLLLLKLVILSEEALDFVEAFGEGGGFERLEAAWRGALEDA